MPRLDNTLFMRLLSQREQEVEKAREDQYRSLQAVGAATANIAAQGERDKVRRREDEYRRRVDAEERREKERILSEREKLKELDQVRTQARIAAGQGEPGPSSSDPEVKRAIALGTIEGREDFRKRIKFEEDKAQRESARKIKEAQESRAITKEKRTSEESEYEKSQRAVAERADKLANKYKREQIRKMRREAKQPTSAETTRRNTEFDNELSAIKAKNFKLIDAYYDNKYNLSSNEKKKAQAAIERRLQELQQLSKLFPDQAGIIGQALQEEVENIQSTENDPPLETGVPGSGSRLSPDNVRGLGGGGGPQNSQFLRSVENMLSDF